MVYRSFPIFPNCKNTLLRSVLRLGALRAGSPATSSWKFFTDGSVTLWRKLRQYCWRCSRHTGALFFNTRGPALLGPGSKHSSNSPKSATDDLFFEEAAEAPWIEYSPSSCGHTSAAVGAADPPPVATAEDGIVCKVHCRRLGHIHGFRVVNA